EMTAQSSAARAQQSQRTARVRVGSAPDSWGVWLPDDPQQVPWQRFLDEVSASGYDWIELGPYGTLPTDPAQLSDELAALHLHADSHVGYQKDIERFLGETDPAYVPLCLDTGHVSYYGGDNLDLIRRYPERIGYLHLKQVDPAVIERVHTEDIPFPQAVQL